jgi:hypothetical protein
MTAALLVHSPPDTYFPSVSGSSPNGICPIWNLYSVTPGSSLLVLDCLRANGPQKGALSPSTGRPRGKGEELPPARAVWSMIDYHLR